MQLDVEVGDGTYSVVLQLTYRWWTPANDPWRATLPGYVGANSGEWYYAPAGRIASFQIFGIPPGTSASRWILTLRNLANRGGVRDLSVGDSGTGLHYISGVLVTDPVEWRITRIV